MTHRRPVPGGVWIWFLGRQLREAAQAQREQARLEKLRLADENRRRLKAAKRRRRPRP